MAIPEAENILAAVNQYGKYENFLYSLALGDLNPHGIVDLASLANRTGLNTGSSIYKILESNEFLTEWNNVSRADKIRAEESAFLLGIFLNGLASTLGVEYVKTEGTASELQFIASAITIMYFGER